MVTGSSCAAPRATDAQLIQLRMKLKASEFFLNVMRVSSAQIRVLILLLITVPWKEKEAAHLFYFAYSLSA